MLDTQRRRPLEPASSVGIEAVISDTPHPGPLAHCPINSRRPRDLDTYRAACRTAPDSHDVRELDACQLIPGMTAWHGGRWLTVTVAAPDATGRGVELHLAGDGVTAARLADRTAPVYTLTGR